MLPLANYYVSSPSMPEKNINNNNVGNKRRKKKRPTSAYGRGEEDDLAVVKAAAWAWYQRKESKPMMREFDLTTREPRTYRPSRYKIEATKNMILSENRVLAENRVSKSSLWYTNYPFPRDQETQYSRLLDTYEIKNISKSLGIDDYGLSLNSSSLFKLIEDDDHHNNGIYDHSNTNCSGSRNTEKESYSGFMKKVSKRLLWKKIVVKGPGPRVCGRYDDVASQASRRTVKVAVAAEAVVRSTASGKT